MSEEIKPRRIPNFPEIPLAKTDKAITILQRDVMKYKELAKSWQDDWSNQMVENEDLKGEIKVWMLFVVFALVIGFALGSITIILVK